MMKLDYYDFNVGDRVRVVNAKGMAASVGATATIKGKEYPYLNIVWDRSNGLASTQFDGRYMPSQFEKAPAEPAGEFILILKRNGRYEPAEYPRVYPTEAQAIAVAKSMANKNKGEEFVVFKTVAAALTPLPVEPVVKRFA